MILQLSVNKNLFASGPRRPWGDLMVTFRHIILLVIVADKRQMALCPLNSDEIHVILAEVI